MNESMEQDRRDFGERLDFSGTGGGDCTRHESPTSGSEQALPGSKGGCMNMSVQEIRHGEAIKGAGELSFEEDAPLISKDVNKSLTHRAKYDTLSSMTLGETNPESES